MGEFFGSIYCWFEDMFGTDLANYLWGEATELQSTNMYIGIGLLMLAISLVSMLVYYYVWNPSTPKTWKWLVMLVINSAINFAVGLWWVQKDLYDDLMKYSFIKDGRKIWLDLDINDINCYSFGFSNMFLSIIAFILFSFLLKWWSRNNRHCPFFLNIL